MTKSKDPWPRLRCIALFVGFCITGVLYVQLGVEVYKFHNRPIKPREAWKMGG